MKRIRLVLIQLDEALNAALGFFPRLLHAGFGNRDETISEVLGRLEKEGSRPATIACKVISFLLRDPDHCAKQVKED